MLVLSDFGESGSAGSGFASTGWVLVDAFTGSGSGFASTGWELIVDSTGWVLVDTFTIYGIFLDNSSDGSMTNVSAKTSAGTGIYIQIVMGWL